MVVGLFRRVKCDEGKPTCLKCAKLRIQCDGYEVRMSSHQASQSYARPILPRSTNQIPLEITPTSARYLDQSEYQYFLHFRDQVTIDLSGTIPQPVWDSVILRACNGSIPLRHLTTSVAALSKARSSPYVNEGNEHRVLAARYYGKALRGIQRTINNSNEEDATRITLFASLLIFCFESLQGEHANATEHIKAALSMIRSRFSTSRRQYSLIQKIAPIPGLEDELFHVFVRIDNTLMTRVSNQSDCSVLDVKYDTSEDAMPPIFHDFSEAKNHLDHYMFCAMPYLARLPQFFLNGTHNTSTEEDAVGVQLLRQLRQWNSAFAPLLASALRPGSRDFIAAAMLRGLGLAAEMSVRKISAPAGKVDLFLEEATEVVSLCRRIVADSSFKKTFVFECGILPVLFMTVMLCPVRSIRLDIIQVLGLAEGRVEVTWNATEVSSMVQFFVASQNCEPQLLLPEEDYISRRS